MTEKQTKNEAKNTNLYILKALENGEKYGYEIIDSVNKLSFGKVEIKQATLYSNLKKLEQKRLINSYWKDSEIGGKRHYYFITDSGRKYLAESDREFTTYSEIIQEEHIKDTGVESFDAKSFGSDDSKAFWSENKYLASKVLQGDSNNPLINKLKKQQTTIVLKPTETTASPTTNKINNLEQTKPQVETIQQPTLFNENNFSNDEIKHTQSATIFISKAEESESDTANNTDTVTPPRIEQNSNLKYDAVILGENEKIESNEETYSMQNRPFATMQQTTDIDYKNILGELYGDKETLRKNQASKAVNSENNSLTQETQIIVPTKTIQLCDTEQIEQLNEYTESLRGGFTENPEREQQLIRLKSATNNFSNYKIKVKPHNKLYKININSDDFIKTNKLNFISSLIGYAIFTILLVISSVWLNDSLNIDSNILKICIGIGAIFPIATLVIFLIDTEKKSKNNFNFKNAIAITTLSCLVVMIFIISICLLCGMTNLNQAKYIYFWLIPALLSISIVAYLFIKNLLIKSNKFNC